MTWTHDKKHDLDQIEGKSCLITLEKRPPYCDRGNFIAKIHRKVSKKPTGDTLRDWMELGIDDQDGFPRYYFDLGRAKAEIEAWLVKRKEAVL